MVTTEYFLFALCKSSSLIKESNQPKESFLKLFQMKACFINQNVLWIILLVSYLISILWCFQLYYCDIRFIWIFFLTLLLILKQTSRQITKKLKGLLCERTMKWWAYVSKFAFARLKFCFQFLFSERQWKLSHVNNMYYFRVEDGASISTVSLTAFF